MKVEEFNAKVKAILENHTDQATVSTILSELVDDYTAEDAIKTAATKTAQELTTANEQLRQANMNLFLKIGSVKEPDPTPQPDTTPKYEDLFDDKGNLK